MKLCKRCAMPPEYCECGRKQKHDWYTNPWKDIKELYRIIFNKGGDKQ